MNVELHWLRGLPPTPEKQEKNTNDNKKNREKKHTEHSLNKDVNDDVAKNRARVKTGKKNEDTRNWF